VSVLRISAALLLLVLISLLFLPPALSQTAPVTSTTSPATSETTATSTSNPPSSSPSKADEPVKPEARAQILKEWKEPRFWIFLLVIALFGAFGGVIYELLLFKGRFELPHKTDDFVSDPSFDGAIAKHLFDLGILGRMLIGAAAAVVVVWLLKFDAQGSLAVIAGSIIAGATGIAVFRSLQDRLLAALATRDLAKTQAQAAAQTQKVEQASAELEKLKSKMASPASPRAVARGAEPGAAPGAKNFSVQLEKPSDLQTFPELENATRLLGEARALGAAAAGAAVSVADQIRQILAAWAGVSVDDVIDDRTIQEVWDTNSDNPKLQEGQLSDLIRRIQRAFPRVQIVLDELAGTTVASLIQFIRNRT
jgi:hypothetical protein